MPHYTAVPIEYSTSSPRPSRASRVSSRAYSRSHHPRDSGHRSHYEAENDHDEFSKREEREWRRAYEPRHRTSGSDSRQSLDSPVDDRYSYEYPHTMPTTAPEVAYTRSEAIPVPAPYPTHAIGAVPAPKITVSAYEYEGFEYTYHPQQPDSHTNQQHRHYHKGYPEHDGYEGDPCGPVPQDSYSGHCVYSTESSHDRPYRSSHSYPRQSYSHHNHPQSPTMSSHHLRRDPSSASNYSGRYSASPPSPTESETSREVNSYGRVPLWYEERVAFTRYT